MFCLLHTDLCVGDCVYVCWLQQGHCISLYCRTYSQPYLKLKKVVMYCTRTQCYLLRGASTRVRLYSTCNPIHNRPSLIAYSEPTPPPVYSGFLNLTLYFCLLQTSVCDKMFTKVIKGCGKYSPF